MKKFYAVQAGKDYSCDYGSTVKREAFRMARRLAKDEQYDGQEIRICVCTTESDFLPRRNYYSRGNKVKKPAGRNSRRSA